MKIFSKENIKEWRDYVLIILVCVIIHTQVVAQSHIPSGSMLPTIQIDDRLLINKLATKYKTPERGDIVVFINETLEEGKEYWIKRVIGEPGDVVDIRQGQVYINNSLLEESYVIGQTFPLSRDIQFPYTVPEESYFLMGDNRERSKDSRMIGSVVEEAIVAIGAYRIYPFGERGTLE